MDTERNAARGRYKQVGFLMRSYRESFVDEEGRRGLSQEALLRRMAEAEGRRVERFNHATVSRWESGATRPSLERLRVFGQALGLTEDEVVGIALLAGLAPDLEAAQAQIAAHAPTVDRVSDPSSPSSHDADNATADSGLCDGHVPQTLASSLMRFIAVKVAVLGLLTVGGGYGLSALGWNGYWMPLVYIGSTSAVVIILGLLRPDREAGLRDFWWTALFILLVTPTLQFTPLQMDHYGFYRLDGFFGTHLPYMTVLLVSLGVAGLSALLFQVLWRWQSTGSRVHGSVQARAVKTVVPPTLVAYGSVLALSNSTSWIQAGVVIACMAVVFIGFLIVEDPSVNPTPAQRRLVVYSTVSAMFMGATMGMIVMLVIFLLPGVPSAFPDHNLLVSWEIDFDRLGYTRAEAVEQLSWGYLWYAMCQFLYVVFVVGGRVLTVAYRMAGGDGAGATPKQETADAAVAPSQEEDPHSPVRLPWTAGMARG